MMLLLEEGLLYGAAAEAVPVARHVVARREAGRLVEAGDEIEVDVVDHLWRLDDAALRRTVARHWWSGLMKSLEGARQFAVVVSPAVPFALMSELRAAAVGLVPCPLWFVQRDFCLLAAALGERDDLLSLDAFSLTVPSTRRWTQVTVNGGVVTLAGVTRTEPDAAVHELEADAVGRGLDAIVRAFDGPSLPPMRYRVDSGCWVAPAGSRRPPLHLIGRNLDEAASRRTVRKLALSGADDIAADFYVGLGDHPADRAWAGSGRWPSPSVELTVRSDVAEWTIEPLGLVLPTMRLIA